VLAPRVTRSGQGDADRTSRSPRRPVAAVGRDQVEAAQGDHQDQAAVGDRPHWVPAAEQTLRIVDVDRCRAPDIGGR